MSDFRRYLYRAALVCAVVGGGTAILYFTGIGCVWQFFLHIDCPGCGMTRAVLALARGDLAAAFSLHPMVWSLPLLFALIVFDGRLFRRKWMNITLMTVLFLGFFLNWIVNLFF